MSLGMRWHLPTNSSLLERAMFAVSSQHLAKASFSSVRKIAVCDGEDREYTEVYKLFSPFLRQNPKNTSLHDIIMEKK